MLLKTNMKDRSAGDKNVSGHRSGIQGITDNRNERPVSEGSEREWSSVRKYL